MTTTPSIEVAELLRSIDAGDELLLLDVRNDDAFEAWRIEGTRPVETIHIPYFNFIEDAADAGARLPGDRQVVVVCAKGGASAMVADVLRDAGISARTVEGGMVAYGDYLQPVKVPLCGDDVGRFELWQINRRGKGCLSYVVRAGGDAVVVDPSRHVERYESLVRDLGAHIVGVLDTHVHADHLSGGPSLAMRNGAPYCVSTAQGVALRHRVEVLLDGARVRLGGLPEKTFEIEIMATPGHTPGCSSYLLGGRYLLSGDTLFVRGVGRPDLGGRALEWGRELYRTLHERLARLPDDTLILPAHSAGPDEMGADGVVCGRLRDLRRTPGFTISSEDAFSRAIVAAAQPPPASYTEIVRANLGPSVIEPAQATEWELGRNQCAAGPAQAAR